MFKKLFILLAAAFLLTGCADNLYPIIDEVPIEEETVIDEEVIDEDVTNEEDSEDAADEDVTDDEVSDDEVDIDETDEEPPAEEGISEEEETAEEEVAEEETVEEEVPEEDEPADGITSCIFSSECPEDRDLCFEGECSILDEVFEKYIDCGPESDSEFNCPETCEGCKEGKLSCLTILNGDYDFKICADCATSYSCEEGYECDSLKHKCVPKE